MEQCYRGFFFFFKQKTAYEIRPRDWRFRRVLFRSGITNRPFDDHGLRELVNRSLDPIEQVRIVRQHDQRALLREVGKLLIDKLTALAFVLVENDRAELFESSETSDRIEFCLRRAYQQHVKPAVVELLLRE